MIKFNFEIYEKLNSFPEVTNPAIYSNVKNQKFHPEGPYSEQIFGPVENYRCQCGKLFGKINAGKRCSECGVLCDTNELRSIQFAKITLPQGIYIINPNFIGNLNEIFGVSPIKNLLKKSMFNENRVNPYFYSLDKEKLIRQSKLKKNQEGEIVERIIDFEVFDITTLKKLFEYLLENHKEIVENKIFRKEIIDYIFLNEIPVIPPNSRPIVPINAQKFMPHAITKLYIKLLTSKKNVSDNLFQENSQLFGYTVYKYQEKIQEIYDKISETNFEKKESYIREALTGKTVEFSQRAVVIPNPALKPYAVGLHKEAIEKLFLPELLRYLYEEFENKEIDDFGMTVIDYLQYIYNTFGNEFQISDKLLMDFLKKKGKDLRLIIERSPVLWKYNLSGVVIGRIFGDKEF